MLPNVLQYPVALFGVLRAGLVEVNVNPQYIPSELKHQLKDSGTKAILVLENLAHTVQEVLDRKPTLNLEQRGAWIAHDLEDGKELLVYPLPLYHV